MTPPIDIDLAQWQELCALLQHYLPNTNAWAYGSRAKHNSTPYSDLDVVVFTTPDKELALAQLQEALEESYLPFRVDLHVWDNLPEHIQKGISAEHKILTQSYDTWIPSECYTRSEPVPKEFIL